VDAAALRLSLALAASTTGVLVALGLPLAHWLVTSPRRWKVLVEALVSLPLVLPPTVLGFYLLVAFSPASRLGGAVATVLGHPLTFSFEGLLVASVLYAMPFAVQPFAAAFASVDRRLVEASRVLGASRWRTFLRVILPLSAPGILAGCVLAFAHVLGEFGVVLMVGGNLAGRTRTLSISIFDAVEALDYERADRTALFLLVASFVALVVTYALRRSPAAGRAR
jgi:molybdate transport system permease protein